MRILTMLRDACVRLLEPRVHQRPRQLDLSKGKSLEDQLLLQDGRIELRRRVIDVKVKHTGPDAPCRLPQLLVICCGRV